MKGLLFLARLALICNVLFLVCVVFQRTPDFISSQAVKATMVILGILLAPFVNLAANIAYLIARVRRRTASFPSWLAFTNFLFLIFEFFISFILPS